MTLPFGSPRFAAALPKAAAAMAQGNFYAFVRGAFVALRNEELSGAPYLEAMAYELERVARGKSNRLLVTMPPRHLKSFCCSVAFPAWMLGHNPDLKVLVASYGEELARDLAGQFRDLVGTPFFRAVFPDFRLRSQTTRLEEIRTEGQGYRRYVVPRGPATGIGADLIVVDDVLKAGDARSPALREEGFRYVTETLFSRFDKKATGRMVVTQQRLHEEDLPGQLLGRAGWQHLNFPVRAMQDEVFPLYRGRSYRRRMGDLLDPDREGEAVLAQVQADMGTRAFNAQYQQNPTPTDSDLIRLERMTFVDELPDLDQFRVRLQSWDTASSISDESKWSVGLTLGRHQKDGRWYLLDVLRAKLEYPELKTAVLEQQARYRPELVLIEAASLGQALLQQFRQEERHRFRPIQARGSKEERFIAQTDFLMSGRFVLPRDRRWLQPFIQELLAFPEASCNDQVDALSQACKWIRRHEEGLDNRDPETGRRLTIRRRDDPKRW